MQIFVYGLYDPIEPNRIRYVGQTADLVSRIDQHCKARDPLTRDWVIETRKLGRPIAHKILEATDPLNGTAAERRWISSFSELDLLNVKLPDRDCCEFKVSPIVPLREMQLLYVRWAVDRFNGNKQAAARALGIGRQTLYNMLRNANT